MGTVLYMLMLRMSEVHPLRIESAGKAFLEKVDPRFLTNKAFGTHSEAEKCAETA